MIDIQEDRMGIGTDDRIVFRNFGLYKILISYLRFRDCYRQYRLQNGCQ